MAKLPTLISDVKFAACVANHLHLILMDENGKEIAEIIFANEIELEEFKAELTKFAKQAFEGENVLQ